VLRKRNESKYEFFTRSRDDESPCNEAYRMYVEFVYNGVVIIRKQLAVSNQSVSRPIVVVAAAAAESRFWRI
jgi:hypothetical protein